MYDTTPIPEAKLPPIYIRKEHKRLKLDPSGTGPSKHAALCIFIQHYIECETLETTIYLIKGARTQTSTL